MKLRYTCLVERTAICDTDYGVSPEVKQIAWKAQQRLCSRYRKLTTRGKNKQRTVTAIARELTGFVWSIGQQEVLTA